MRACLLASLIAGAGCAERAADGAFELETPGRIAAALTMVDDLSAHAHLVPGGGGASTTTAPLTIGDDGASFSGFVPAEPGNFTVEIVFAGRHAGDRLFLGRLVSDAFTVADGDTVTAVFSRPLDPIGRAGYDAGPERE